MLKILSILQISLLLGPLTLWSQSKKCTIQGEIVSVHEQNLLLYRAGDFYKSIPDTIPVKGGEFHYQFDYECVQAYQLIFQQEMESGSWMPIVFFPTEDSITFILHGYQDYLKNQIFGGKLNENHNRFQRKITSSFYEPIWGLDEKLGISQEEPSNSSEINELQTQMDSLMNAYLKYYVNFITSDNSFLSFYYLFAEVKEGKFLNLLDHSILLELVENKANLFPKHPYTLALNDIFNSLNTVREGGKYIDFGAQSASGELVQLSSLKGDKLVLLNMWGSWCAPCIKKSRLLLPIHQQYAGDDFEILGIAREFGDLKAFKARLEKEMYPWENLIELDDKGRIWQKYNIGVGAMFLIDRDGTILAVNPSIDRIEAILSEKL